MVDQALREVFERIDNRTPEERAEEFDFLISRIVDGYKAKKRKKNERGGRSL